MAERPVVLPPQSKGDPTVTLAYPRAISWEIDRNRRRESAVPVRVPLNDNDPADGICPACHAPAPTTPIASDRLRAGRIHQHWLCKSCGHEWSTLAHVVS
jgi:hypothetical protein